MLATAGAVQQHLVEALAYADPSTSSAFPLPEELFWVGASPGIPGKWCRVWAQIRALLCDLGEVSSPLWALLPHLKNVDSNYEVVQVHRTDTDRGVSTPTECSASGPHCTIIPTVLCCPPTAERDEAAMSPSPWSSFCNSRTKSSGLFLLQAPQGRF